MGNYSKHARPVVNLVQLNLFGEEPAPTKAVTVDIVHWSNNTYRRKNGLYYQVINKNEYEVVDQFVISQVHAVWIDQNKEGATLFIDGEAK